jgi:hypothetical protein
MPRRANKLDEGCFLNVDLEIFSRMNLEPLVAAFGRNLSVLYLGEEFGKKKAYFELRQQPRTPNRAILKYSMLVRKLPPRGRKLWDSATSRSFDIGIAAPARYRHFWGAISPEAIRAAADIGAQVAITVYGPMKPVKTRVKRKTDATQ